MKIEKKHVFIYKLSLNISFNAHLRKFFKLDRQSIELVIATIFELWCKIYRITSPCSSCFDVPAQYYIFTNRLQRNLNYDEVISLFSLS